MEMKPDEAGTDANIGQESILKHLPNYVGYIRACGRIKKGGKLSLSW